MKDVSNCHIIIGCYKTQFTIQWKMEWRKMSKTNVNMEMKCLCIYRTVDATARTQSISFIIYFYSKIESECWCCLSFESMNFIMFLYYFFFQLFFSCHVHSAHLPFQMYSKNTWHSFNAGKAIRLSWMFICNGNWTLNIHSINFSVSNFNWNRMVILIEIISPI